MPTQILPRTNKNNYWTNSIKLFDKYEKLAADKLRIEYRRLYEDTLTKVKAMLYELQQKGITPTPATMYKYDSYYKLMTQLKDKLNVLAGKEEIILEQSLTDFYKANSSIITSLLELPVVKEETIKQAIQQIWCKDGLSWSDRIWKHKDQLQQLLSEGIVNSVARGDSSAKLAATLKNAFGVSYNEAKRLAVTELAHVQIKSAVDSYNEAGIQYYKVLVAPAENVCEECKQLENKLFPVDQLVLPAHPNCRCCTLAVFEQEKKDVSD